MHIQTLYDGAIELTFDFATHKYNVRNAQIKDSEFEPVPSVTSILRVLDKPALVFWREKMYKQYLEQRFADGGFADEVAATKTIANLRHALDTDTGATVGTLTHRWIEDFIKQGSPPPKSSNAQVAACVDAFLEWWEGHHVEPVGIERQVYSKIDGVAGTLDLLWKDREGILRLTDWKSGNTPKKRKTDRDTAYLEWKLQSAAYAKYVAEEDGVDPPLRSVVHLGNTGKLNVYLFDENRETGDIEPTYYLDDIMAFEGAYLVHQYLKG